MTRPLLLLSTVALICAPAVGAGQVVERVVDGDTLIVAGVGRVRLIGVDTPESVDPRRPVQFFGKEASAFAQQMLEGRQVRLEYDQERTDSYGRTLAYVYLHDGTFANAEIIRQGYGHAYTRFPFRYRDRFRQYEREAREARRGLWGATAAERRASSALPAEAARYDDDGNGAVSCAEAYAHAIAPVRRGHPVFAYLRDADGDGVACEAPPRNGRDARAVTRREPARSAALDRYDDNSNGRISCAEARAHGIAPVRRGHPAYQHMRDGNNDGVICE